MNPRHHLFSTGFSIDVDPQGAPHSVTMGSLESLVTRCPMMAVDVLSTYLEFSDFLSLSATCSTIRNSLIAQEFLWKRYYERREPTTALTCHSSFPQEHAESYRLNQDENQPFSFDSLVDTAKRSGIVPQGGSTTSIRYLDLAAISASYSRRTSVDRDLVKAVPRTASAFVLNENGDVWKPFTIVNKTILFGYDHRLQFFRTQITTTTTDETRMRVISARWLNETSCPYCNTDGDAKDEKRSVETKDSGSHPQFPTSCLSLLYTDSSGAVAVSIYRYDATGFAKRPSSTWRLSVEPSKIACVQAFAANTCGHFSVFVGTTLGSVYMRNHDGETLFQASEAAITAIDVVAVRRHWFLSLALEGDRALFLRIRHTHVVLKQIAQVTSFAVDIPCGIVGHCSNKRCTVFFSSLRGLEAQVGVPKPPSSIMFLRRRSLWILVIRNYLKLVRLDLASGTLVVQNVRVLNGHALPVTDCRDDGWHRLASIDTGGSVIIWDLVKGSKIVALPQLFTGAPARKPEQGCSDSSPVRRKKNTVNRQISYASIHNAKKNFNKPPEITAPSDSDEVTGHLEELSLGPRKPNSQIDQRPRDSGKKDLHFSVEGLYIYYRNLSCIRTVTFK